MNYHSPIDCTRCVRRCLTLIGIGLFGFAFVANARVTQIHITETIPRTATGKIDLEGYAKASLKKYRPIAARNEDKKVFSGLL